MKTPTCSLAICAVIGLAPSAGIIFAQGSGGDWKAYSPQNGSFSASFPEKPAEFKKEITTAIGRGELVIVQVVVPPGASKYMVSCSEYPPGAIKPGTEDKRLENARDGALSASKGRLKRERPLLLDSYPGREVYIEVDGNVAVMMRMYAVKNRLYEIVAVGSADFVTSKDTAKFFESFKLPQ